MRRFAVFVIVFATGLAMAAPSVAQQVLTRQGNETAMEMAMRVDLCEGRGIASAEFVENGARLRVRCAAGAITEGSNIAGMTGGLGASGAVGVGILLIAIASGGGSSSSTSSTN